MAQDWHFPRRDLARSVFVTLTQGPLPALTLFGPRRTGKTAFLTRDLAFVAGEQYGHRVVYADFWGAPADPLALLIYEADRALRRASHAARLAAWAEALPLKARLSMTADIAGAEIELGPPRGAPDAAAVGRLGAVLDRLANPARPAILMLDEFQEIGRHPGGAGFMAALRSQLTRHRDGLRSVFTGSSRVGLDRVFTERDAPFFRFAGPLDLPPFDAAFVDHQLGVFHAVYRRRLDRAVALDFFAQFGANPMFFQRWLVTLGLNPAMTEAAAADETAARLAAELGLADMWRGWPPLRRAMARLLAERAEAPYGEAAGARLAALTGAPAAPAPAQRQAALRWLVRNGLADQVAGAWRLADPVFEAWVLAQPEAAG